MKRTKLIKARKLKKLTQSEIANEVGISTAHYSAIERGDRLPAYDVMVSISKFFGKKPDDFFYSKNLLKVDKTKTGQL